MFGRGFKLFTVFGFEVKVDLSWFIIAILVTWSLAAQVFPAVFHQFFPAVADTTPTSAYWALGVVGALGLFLSVVVHELSHSLMARHFGVEMRGITLFIFGGVAEMYDEPRSARAEFMVAVVGPLTSIGIGVGALAGLVIAGSLGAPPAVEAVLGYLGFINLLLAVFNMIPAFPLDGGRVLRSALWQWRNDLRWATRISSQIGSAFGIFLIVLGVLVFVRGDPIGGMWWFLIGLFVRNAAQMSYQQLLLRRVLEGEKVARFMETNPVTVPRAISVAELVESYVYRYHFKMFPVVDGDRLLGCITTRQLKQLPREEWERQSVGAVAESCTAENTVSPGLDAMQALSIMNKTGQSRLMVVESDRLVGILSLKDLLKFFSLKMELGDT